MPEFFGVTIDETKAQDYKKAFMVCGMSCSYELVNYGEAVYQGYEVPQGFTERKAFCEACHDIYTREKAKLINHNVNRGLDQAGKPIKNEGEYLNMRHKNFKDYAADAKKVYDASIKSHQNILERWKEAQENWKEAQNGNLSELDAAIAKASFM